ncbi:alpha/beta-hydrolase [Penicillium chermesinum]|nr:alpha/beta-hydrolase [Penicillium chermesinum]
MDKPAVVIVPGAWHRPQHYQYVIDGLKNLGYETEGIDLPSVDSSPPHATWEKDAEEVRRVILKYLDTGKDVIALAHSFGGIAMSEAVKGLGKESREAKGLKGSVSRLIYMCAMALPKGQSYASQMVPATPEEEELDKQRKEMQEKYGGMQFKPDGSMVLDKDACRMVLYNGCDPEDADKAVSLLGSFPAGPLSVPVTYTAYLEIPSTYILCRNDQALAACIQERIVAQGNGALHVERCDEGHSPFLSNPNYIVRCVRRAAGRAFS